MSQEHAATLLNLTGDLFPAPGTPPAQLTDLRRILYAALLAGETSADIGLREFTGEPVNGGDEEIEQLGDAPAPPPSPNRVAHRTTFIPAVEQFTGRTLWAAAQLPLQTLGPFQDSGRRLHWFDVFAPAPFFNILAQGVNGPAALLPHGTALAGGVLNLPAGSVWLNAALIPTGPAGTWAGLKITGGTGTPGGPVQVNAGGMLLRVPNGGVTLNLNLDTQNLAGFPDTVTVAISANGIRVSAFGPGSLTAFGSTVGFVPANGAPVFDPSLRSLLFPLTVDPGVFTATPEPGTELFRISGSAEIQSAAWALPLARQTPAALVEAEGPGLLAVTVAPGLEVKLPGTDGGSIALNQTTILTAPGRTALFAPSAANPRATQILQGWFEDRVVRQSAVELARDASFPCWFFHLDTGAEAVFTRAQLTLHTDRPLRASGERLESRIPVSHLLEHDELGSRVTLLGHQQVGAFRPFALALPNALLTVAEPSLLELSATLSAPSEMHSGALHLSLPLYQLLPTLPDPYAANFELKAHQNPDDSLRVVATVIWTEPFDARLDLMLDPPPFNMQSLNPVLPAPTTFRPRDEMNDRFNALLRHQIDEGLVLLDISSNAAQLGVALCFGDQPKGGLSIRDLTLNVAGSNAAVFILPQFQCEPVFNKDPRVPGETEKQLFFDNDAGPTLAAAETVRLVPVRPVALLDEVVNSYEKDKNNAGVVFTLPFGIQAVAQLDPNDRQFRHIPTLQIVAPRFENFDGAPQLSLTAGTKTTGQVWIAGRARQLDNVTSSPPPGALGLVVGDAFNTAFSTGVPIDRVRLSGYGANIFSRWFDTEKDPDVGITQVAFDAFHGRTSYERVMLTSYLLPCCARVVRTITFERYGNGAIVRWDSGWLATTPGLFKHPNFTFHNGVVGGIENIREIMDTDFTVDLGNGAVMQAVYYDGDIAVDGVLRGGDGNGRVPARRHLGFIQQLNLPPPPPVPPAGPIRAALIHKAQLTDLFNRQGRLGGPVDCQIKVGASVHEMKVSGIFATNASNNEFAVAAYGSPTLRGPGQWSVVRVNNGNGSVEPLDNPAGVPLVRAGAGPFRWADPADLLQANPAADYAVLFASSAQRILFLRPKVDQLATKITSELPPLLADPYALMKSPGLFPGLKDAIPFNLGGWGLDSAAGALQFTPTPFHITAVAPKFNLLKTSSWLADLEYKDADGNATKFIIESAADWAIKATGMQQVIEFPVVKEIMRVVHGIEAPSIGDDSFPNPKVKFSDALETVTDVLRMLREWAPNLPAPLHVDAGFKGSSFVMSAVADFDITDSEGNALDCGMGKLKGNLKIGADLSIDIFKRTTNGAIFFEVGGTWQQMIFPLIYGGGMLRFAVRAEQSGDITLELDAAVTGSVGGDIIPGLVSLEATVKYGYFLFTNPIMPGILVGIEGRAKLLSGLLGFKLGIEGRIGITREPHALTDLEHICKLHGEILVAGTVTVAWLIEERKSFRTHYDVNVDWKMALVAAGVGLQPVP